MQWWEDKLQYLVLQDTHSQRRLGYEEHHIQVQKQSRLSLYLSLIYLKFPQTKNIKAICFP